ncbi:hypothetical protein B566_EDAN016323 [Ephemera danica]|nr:hypothetical protein B566_EDAN016323 [Ephemera danica]
MADCKEKRFHCKTCDNAFTTSSNLYRHTRKVHGNKAEYVKCQKKCLTCGECFNNRKLLTDHIATAHKVKIETIKRSFNSLQDFEDWKLCEETKTGNYYFRSHRYFNQAKGYVSSLYVCHRDGNYKSINTGQRSIKRQGSCKINATCPSTINLKMNSQTLKCSMEYITTHVGHDSNPVHSRLQKVQRHLIAEKLKENVPTKKILEDVNSQIPETSRQLTHKDVLNIKSSVWTEKPEPQLDPDDHTSVSKWVERLQDQILYYKPKSETENEFILIFQPSQQVCWDPVIIWVGETKDLIYDYHLISMVAVDENGERFPLAHMVTSTINQESITQLYSCIKNVHGVVHCSHFMIKNFATFATPWEKVMGTKYNKILSSWCVNDFWKAQLNLNYDECKDLHKDLLYLLQKEEYIESFQNTIEKIAERLKTIPRLKEYTKLVLKYFRHRQTWAKCFRVGIHESTDKNIIAFEKRLKKICFDGKVAGRLDSTLYTLHKFVNESKKIDTSFKAVTKRIRVAHRESIKIVDADIEAIDDFWRVKVGKNVYQIQRGLDECSCNVRCSICDICEHSLKCSCGSNVICKHIHAVARIFVLDPEEAGMKHEEHSSEGEMVMLLENDDESASVNNDESALEINDESASENDDDLHEIFPDHLDMFNENVDEIDDPIENNLVQINEKDVIIQEKLSSIVKLCVEKLPHASDDFVTRFIKDLQNLENSLLTIEKPEDEVKTSSRRKTKHKVRTELSE